jgi:5-methylcytosine-specific restriction endonuclease McrA
MPNFSLSHLSDEALRRDLHAAVSRETAGTATVVAHIAEFDARKLYVPAAYPSMFAYCVGELHLSEDAAYKRIQAGRVARRCPGVLEALADSRLHLTAVVLLAPHLTPKNEAELIAASTHKSKAEIEQVLAERFPRLDVPTRVEAIRPAVPANSLPVLEPVRNWPVAEQVSAPTVPATAEALPPRPRVAPLAPQRFALQVTIGQGTYEKLQHVRALLGPASGSADLAAVLDRALDALARELEKRKFAATSKPRRRRPSDGKRHVPAAIKRAVWQRDGGRCTFVGESGRRCEARAGLEFDHVHEVARGGAATVGGIRLRCRAHNQYEAERTFGPDFMRHKRETARSGARGASGDHAARV